MRPPALLADTFRATLSWAMVAASTCAQNTPPGAHWGMSLWPASRSEERLTFQFHRFTEESSTGALHPSGIQETTGFNLATLAVTRELLLAPTHRLTYTLEGGIGTSNDQPTEWLQNNYVHQIRHLPRVAVGDRREETEYVGAGAVNYWLGCDEPRHRPAGFEPPREEPWRWQGFLGVGYATGTIHHETFLQGGASLLLPEQRVRLSIMDRVGWPKGSEAYVDVAPVANVLQIGVAYVPEGYYLSRAGTWSDLAHEVFRWRNLVPTRWPSVLHAVIGRPEVGAYLTWDSGLFVDPSRNDNPIDTRFLSLRFDWPTGLRLETWNDIFNDTDYGPSYGLLVSVDLAAFFQRTR